MAIKSSSDITRIVKPEQSEEEIISEISLRPRTLTEYV